MSRRRIAARKAHRAALTIGPARAPENKPRFKRLWSDPPRRAKPLISLQGCKYDPHERKIIR